MTPPLLLTDRPRRNRKSSAVRSLVCETTLTPNDLIAPHFIVAGKNVRSPIKSLPGIYRLSIDLLLGQAELLLEAGIRALALFPVIDPALKDPEGCEALNPSGLLQEATRSLKKRFPELCLIADVALDAYTTHGHDGLVDESGEVLNDETVNRLCQMALIQAESGIDIVAPSDMMDGRVGAIRGALDERGFQQTSILAYTAKYASAFYGPYRDALGSHPSGDKKGYQMDPANSREAEREVALDMSEGADILMVKPALPYLDVIAKIRPLTPLPIAAYQVSGEYAMLMAAAQNGWLDSKRALLESLLCIKRAGADMVFSYGALEVARALC